MENNVYSVETVEPGLWRIEENGMYMYLIEGEEAALLIDAGYGGGKLRELVESLTEKPVELFCTHAHGDHIGAANQYDWCYLHPSDWAVADGTELGRSLDFETIEAEDIIDLGGGLVLEAVHIPGHTPGSTALMETQRGWIFAGDAVQTGPAWMFMPESNLRAQLVSLQKLQDLDYTTIYPAHGEKILDKSILPELMDACRRILAGDLAGTEVSPAPGLTCKLYESGRVSLFGR